MANEKFLFGSNNYLYLDNDSNSINSFLIGSKKIETFNNSKTFSSIKEFITRFPNKKITIFIMPDKNEVYNEYLPFKTEKLLTPLINKDLKGLFNYKKNITIVDLYKIFQKNNDKNIYSPLDSHININGLELWLEEINKIFNIKIDKKSIMSNKKILSTDLLNPVNIKEFLNFKNKIMKDYNVSKDNIIKYLFSNQKIIKDLSKFYSQEKIEKLCEIVLMTSPEFGIKAPKNFNNVSYYGIDKKNNIYNNKIFDKIPFLKKYESYPSRYLEYFQNKNPVLNKKLLIIGDSFSDFIKNILSCYFKELLFINYAYLINDLIEDYNPDEIIFQKASRFMLKEK